MIAEDFAPVDTLAACKHPFAAAGMDPAAFRDLSRVAEMNLLRGPRPPAGLDGLAQVLATLDAREARGLRSWLDRLAACCGGFASLMREASVPFARLLATHMEMAEALAATPEMPGALRLWTGDAGEAAAAFVAEVAQEGAILGVIPPAIYLGLFEVLMEGRVVRPRYGRHPRLAILGPLEARLQNFEVMILGGLNEGTWPAEPPADPWMSRPMRKRFGLPAPERRIGLAAHDFAQALANPRVFLTRATRVEGTPTVPSRWLMRLERVIAAAGLEKALPDGGDWLAWGRALSRPGAIAPCAAPAPTPPVAARPRKLSVTEIEKWMRDPYSIYARHVLRLRALEPLDQDAGAADYGMLIHAALHAFVAAHPTGPLPPDAAAQLIAAGEGIFAERAPRPGVLAFWRPRFARVAQWFLAEEATRRGALKDSWVEVTGELTLHGPAGPFVLTARADRIDRFMAGLTLIDYKTGTPPKTKEVAAGFAPQLPLEAAIAAAGGFTAVPRAAIAELAFWHLHGRADGGNIVPIDGDPAALAEAARRGLENLIAKFDHATTPYQARPNPSTAPVYSDYLHLARVKEWGAVAGENAS
jgi:ATP-dependent helicase/nuclease subunit B